MRLQRAARAGLLLVCAAALMVAPSALADGPSSAELSTAEAGNLWFVELKSSPTADGGTLAAARADKAAFRSEAKAVGVKLKERLAFDTLWNGLSIEASPATASRLSALTSVKAVYPVLTMHVPETQPSPELGTALAMTGADTAQSELGYTGAGVKVAVMDTGVDYDHPDLGGCFGPGCRVVAGYDFVGDAFNANPNAPGYNPTPVPDEDPDDCHGHGTHVAGIVGASGGATGVAPGVQFGAYRVFGCDGSTTADIMIAAMERALADGMDVLNMSIGSAFQTWPQYPTGAASDRLVNRGMVVVASIGNSGGNGVYSAGSPGVGKKVIGVASYDNSHVALASFTVSPDDTRIGYGNAAAAPPAPTSGSLPMARTGTTTTPDDACEPLAEGSLAGMAVLIRRGTCTFHIKALNAQNAGAAAVVLYNNAAGRFSPTVAGVPAITIPVVAISDTEGALIDGRLAAGPVTLTWSSESLFAQNPTGGLISGFSSYGLTAELDLKPDIGGPGGLIRSTYPLERGGYATVSGTSMSSPHVAGAVALLLEAKPNTPAQAVRSILQNTAEPKLWWGNPGLGFLDQVHRQGAGMVRIDRAILATTTVEPGKLPLGESEAGPQTRTLKVKNTSSSTVTYTPSLVNALSTGGSTFAPGAFLGGASAAFSAASVEVPAGGTGTLDVTITAPAGPASGQYGGYVVLSGDDGSTTRVPFAGFVGDYQSLPVLTAGTAGVFPTLARHNGFVSASDFNHTHEFVGEGAVFTMQSSTVMGREVLDIPYVAAHMSHQSRRVTLELFTAAGKRVGVAHQEQHVRRNGTNAGTANSSATDLYLRFPINGSVTAGKKTTTVPNGSYYVVVSVEKALADEGNPAHTETWTSPTFTIARP